MRYAMENGEFEGAQYKSEKAMKKGMRDLEEEIAQSKCLDEIDRQILCFYFQKQQRSYLVNRYNRKHPDSPIQLSDAEEEEEEGDEGDETEEEMGNSNSEDSDGEVCGIHEQVLSQYEKDRLERIRENEARVAQVVDDIKNSKEALEEYESE